MYIFKPISDKEKLREIFHDDVNGGYIGYDGEEIIGKCSLTVDGYKVYVKTIEFASDKPDVGEGLMRSALNFGANRNAYFAYCSCENATEIMKLMGFEEKDGVFSGDIPTLLGGSCGCCHHKNML